MEKFLGLRGVGIINNEKSDIYFAPTRSCIMMKLVNSDFCEVCRTELFNYDGSDIVCDAEHKYTSAKVMVFDGTESLRPLCRAETVTLN